jgi:hypothetical protein
MERTLIAFYRIPQTAGEVAENLVESGFSPDHIYLLTDEIHPRMRLKALLDTGLPEARAIFYATCVQAGASLVAVQAIDATARRAAEILARHDPIDADERADLLETLRRAGYDPFEGLPGAGYRPHTFYDIPPGDVIVEPPLPEDADLPPGNPIVLPPDPTRPTPPPGRPPDPPKGKPPVKR